MSQFETHRTVGGAGSLGEASPLRIAVADDHPAYRGRLAAFLSDRGLCVVGEVANGQAAIDLSARAKPDVILMDLRMPLVSGVEAIRQLTEDAPSSRILAISAAALEDEIADAILWGASGHFAKDRPLAELIWAIEATAAGLPLLPPGIAQVLLRRVQGGDPERSLVGAPLLRRELNLLACLAHGTITSPLAAALPVSVEALNRDIGTLLAKLRVEQQIQEALVDADDS
jgi:DNA-binding NarL/FixJ family response regulator